MSAMNAFEHSCSLDDKNQGNTSSVDALQTQERAPFRDLKGTPSAIRAKASFDRKNDTVESFHWHELFQVQSRG